MIVDVLEDALVLSFCSYLKYKYDCY